MVSWDLYVIELFGSHSNKDFYFNSSIYVIELFGFHSNKDLYFNSFIYAIELFGFHSNKDLYFNSFIYVIEWVQNKIYISVANLIKRKRWWNIEMKSLEFQLHKYKWNNNICY